MKIIIVGAGGTARELLQRLGKLWDSVVLVDTDEHHLEAAVGLREFTPIVGDGSSGLVLRRAGLDDADALVAATFDDDVNLEAARIAREAGLLRVLAVAADPTRLADYRAIQVPAFAPHTLTARRLEAAIDPRRVASTTFADGRAEAIEFVISPDAAVRGKRLRDLHAASWVVAAVLRGGDLIVPHGETQLEAGDRVTVVGAASDYAALIKTFTSGESRFPYDFGHRALVALDGAEDLAGPVAEAVNLVHGSTAESLIVLYPDPEAERDGERATEMEGLLEQVARIPGIEVELRARTQPRHQALLELIQEESVGVVVVPAPGGGRLRGRTRVAKLLSTYGPGGIPVLVSRGSYPYRRIIVPARRTVVGETAARAAIDLAQAAGGEVHGVAVVAPAFAGGSAAALEDARRATAWLREEAAVQGVDVRRHLRRGNPIRVMEEIATEDGLLVIGMPETPVSPWRLGVASQLVRRAECSVLVVPAER